MIIKFLLDENIPYALVEFLENRGYTASHLKKIGKSGIKNGEVYKIAEDNNMWIITRDADFQNYYKFMSYNVAGIIVIKLTNTRTHFLLKAIDNFLEEYSDKLSKKHLIIIEDDQMRVY